MRTSGRMGKDPQRMHVPKMVRLISSIPETPMVRTITVRSDLGRDAHPGQFFMVWIPHVDEVPMSMTAAGETTLSFAVHNKGEATAALHALRIGEMLGIRGPYGVGYRPPAEGWVLIAAGGTGIASLVPVIESLKGRAKVVLGAKTASEVLFEQRTKASGAVVTIVTDDGTSGEKGLVTDVAMPMLEKRPAAVLTCGPEAMMRKIVEACVERDIPVQASLDRYMKCGTGICDSCSIGGIQVCKEGPVFDGRTVITLPEFGIYRRDACGRRERV